VGDLDPAQGADRVQTIAQKAIAYGFDGIQVDGNDILSVYAATQEAIEKARTGGGPTLIEAVTYRLAMHTTADDPKKYRKEEEVKEWEPRDPLLRFEQYLRKKKLLDDKVQQGHGSRKIDGRRSRKPCLRETTCSRSSSSTTCTPSAPPNSKSSAAELRST
jgi:TPP-dependent pyruvate/acetoin dehydrogenase alpha subunit